MLEGSLKSNLKSVGKIVCHGKAHLGGSVAPKVRTSETARRVSFVSVSNKKGPAYDCLSRDVVVSLLLS